MIRGNLVTIICISAILLCSSCNGVSASKHTEPITVILGAFDEEVAILRDQLADKHEQNIEGIKFAVGRLNGRKVAISTTGIGKVNAAMTTTLAIEHFRPSEIIFTGIAGGINPQLRPGDVVIAEKTAQHDLGILTPEGIENVGGQNPIDDRRNPVFFPADERLFRLAQRASERLEPEKKQTNAEQRPPKIQKGVIVTGDVFIASTAKSAQLRERLGADAVEMEGAAVAQVCYQHKIPCIVIRGISDMAGENSLENVNKFLEIAASNSANLVAEMVILLSIER